MPNLIVPGAGGFIGVNLLRRIMFDRQFDRFERFVLIDPLSYGTQTIPQEVLADSRVRFERASIYTPGLVADLVGPGDVVIHLAAEINTADSPQMGVADDPVGYLRALTDARIGRLLFVSTADVYGINDSDDLTETDPVHPTTLYAAAKAAFEAYLSAFHARDGLPVVVLRPVTIYGPHQQPGWLVPVAITRALAGESIAIYGDGTARRDWIHVYDMCEVLVRGALTEAEVHGQVFNVGTGTEETVAALVHRIIDSVADPRVVVEYTAARPGDPPRQITSASKARHAFGWSPSRTLSAGLEHTIDAYRRAHTG
ncbi:NAD-dependent epimerase/dehydratase family protein [Nocardia sp. NPDC057227]|uniref:NAD-dependent epimerase/dehydratase family protein n=1 Tax=Nocardia sp. NPDC057227 TaxID=3346056 RepID=UPI003627DDA6